LHGGWITSIYHSRLGAADGSWQASKEVSWQSAPGRTCWFIDRSCFGILPWGALLAVLVDESDAPGRGITGKRREKGVLSVLTWYCDGPAFCTPSLRDFMRSQVEIAKNWDLDNDQHTLPFFSEGTEARAYASQ
jgi:hypothetical protein